LKHGNSPRLSPNFSFLAIFRYYRPWRMDFVKLIEDRYVVGELIDQRLLTEDRDNELWHGDSMYSNESGLRSNITLSRS
jgi:hypothetical protein